MILNNIQVDIFGIIILLLILIKSSSHNDKIQNGYFKLLIYTTIVVLILDMGMWFIDKQTFKYAYYINEIISLFYYLITPLVGLFAMFYCNYSMHHSKKLIRLTITILMAPLIVYWMVCISSVLNGFIFYVDENNVYNRGKYFWLSIIITFACFLYTTIDSIILSFKTNSKNERREYHYITFFIVPPAIGSLFQAAFYGLATNWVGVIISILIMFINIQNNEISSDPLTGLFNRRVLYKYLSTNISSLTPNQKLFAFLIDLDKFKYINDNFGHAEGDNALITAAQIMTSVCEIQDDFLARMGGDEFAIICIRDAGVKMPELVDLLQHKINKYNETSKDKYNITFSIGCAVYGESDTNTVDALMRKADHEMYYNKNLKKNL